MLCNFYLANVYHRSMHSPSIIVSSIKQRHKMHCLIQCTLTGEQVGGLIETMTVDKW